MAYTHVLVASGGAPHSRKAEERAVKLAKGLAAKLSLISVVRERPSPVSIGGAIGSGLDVGSVDAVALGTTAHSNRQQHQERILTAAKERCEAHGLAPTTIMRMGNAAKAIVETAQEIEADLIMVGSKQMSILGALTRGSTSDYVMRHAACDVLIVHSGNDS